MLGTHATRAITRLVDGNQVDRHRVAYGGQDEKSPIPEGLGGSKSRMGQESEVSADDCASLKATATVIRAA